MMDENLAIVPPLDHADDVGVPHDYSKYLVFPGGRLRVSEGTPADFSSTAAEELVTPLTEAYREIEPA
jgi:hypothetical protein